MKRERLYLPYVGIAGVALYYACRLSQSGRGPVDWIVIAGISGALLFSVVRLGQRLYVSGGASHLWLLLRTAIFWAIGLMNTMLAPAAESGTWKNVLGWVVIALAVFDSVGIHRAEMASLRQTLDPDRGPN